jgi:hypothetical protein
MHQGLDVGQTERHCPILRVTAGLAHPLIGRGARRRSLHTRPYVLHLGWTYSSK